MATTFNYLFGDAVLSDKYNVTVLVPDSGTTLVVQGTLQAAAANNDPLVSKAATVVTIAPTTFVLPAFPGSGNIFLNIQVDITTGVATMQQSTVAAPVPINANNRIVFSITLPTGQTRYDLQSSITLPSTPLGLP